jgi:uncharacterized delta-60 repeat protein
VVAMSLQPDGKVILASYCENAPLFTTRFCVVRFNSDGTLDTSFAQGGSTVEFGQSLDYQEASSMALQPDGKIIVAGTCSPGTARQFCVARLDGGPFGAQHCSLDIDGDNKVLATTDAQIHARIARGIRGSAVVAGVAFTPGATRTTWPQVREYLVSQCGMIMDL